MTEGTYIAIIGTMIVFILGALFAMVNSLRKDFKDFSKIAVTMAMCEREHKPIEEAFSGITDWVARAEKKIDTHLANGIRHIVE